MRQETVTLTNAEMKKVLVVEKILDGRMTNREGANVLGLSVRQVIRLKKSYQLGGAQQLTHKNRGRKSAHALPEEVKDQVADLYTTKYYDSNNCHFAELLGENESVHLSPSSVRRILLAKGMKQVKQQRRGSSHQPRERKAQAGMLWQIDATPYAWLEERASAFALHAAIDDATGTVVGAVFRPTECSEGYAHVMQEGIHKYGVPLGLYSDQHTIFRSPNEKLTIEQELAGETMPLSQFGKAMVDLHIEHIKALTPQAKGRVERLWLTLQDRLVIELRLLGITTIEQANEALPRLIQKHNRKFAVAPKMTESAYATLDPSIHLDHIFTIREYRKLGSGNTLSYNSKIYTLAEPRNFQFETKMTVEVRETHAGEVLLWHRGQAFMLKETEKPARRAEPTKKAASAHPRKPAASHPWKAWKQQQVKDNTNSTNAQIT